MSSDVKQETIEVSAADLPIYCPNKHTTRWNMHPRVFLDVTKLGEVTCPYCSAHYRLKAGEKVHSH